MLPQQIGYIGPEELTTPPLALGDEDDSTYMAAVMAGPWERLEQSPWAAVLSYFARGDAVEEKVYFYIYICLCVCVCVFLSLLPSLFIFLSSLTALPIPGYAMVSTWLWSRSARLCLVPSVPLSMENSNGEFPFSRASERVPEADYHVDECLFGPSAQP